MVGLREWTVDDADWYAGTVANDELILRFTTESPDVTADEVRAAILALSAGAPDRIGYLIHDPATGERLGNIAITYEDGVGHVSYWLAEAARGRGVATEAVRLMCARAFAEHGLREIRLYARADNAASRAVAERAGFRRDPGRDRTRVVRGRPWPDVAYSLPAPRSRGGT